MLLFWLRVRVRRVHDVRDLALQVLDSVAVVQQHEDDGGGAKQCQYDHDRYQTAVRSFSFSNNDGLAGVLVAAVADEAALTHAAPHRVAHPVPGRRTVARLHAVVAEVPLRAELGAVVAGVSGRAAAVAVDGAARGAVRAPARLRAVDAPPAGPARLAALGAAPAGPALTHSGDVMTVGVILTNALVLTVQAVRPERARVLARHARVAARTAVLASHGIACCIFGQRVGTALRAAGAVRALGTGPVAALARPAGRAHAAPRVRRARRVVCAAARLRARGAERARRALRLATDSSPGVFADAVPGDVVAAHRVAGTVAGLRAALAEVVGLAVPLAARARVPRPAHALPGHWVTRRVVLTVTRLSAVQSKCFTVTRSVAFQAIESWFAAALSRLVRAGGVVVAVAGVGAVISVERVGTLLLAVETAVPRGTQARTIDRRAEAVVFAAACRATPLAVSEQWTLSRARVAPPPRCALARAGPRVAQISCLRITVAVFVAVRPPLGVVAGPQLAVRAAPPRPARARAVLRRTRAAVLARARVRAVHAVRTDRTYIQTLLPRKACFTLAFSCNVMTTSAISTLAGSLTFFSPSTCRTSVSTNISGPASSTLAVVCEFLALSIILAPAVLGTSFTRYGTFLLA